MWLVSYDSLGVLCSKNGPVLAYVTEQKQNEASFCHSSKPVYVKQTGSSLCNRKNPVCMNKPVYAGVQLKTSLNEANGFGQYVEQTSLYVAD